MKKAFALAVALALVACRSSSKDARAASPALPPGAEAISLQGEPLFPPPMKAEDVKKREDDLAAARAECERKPDDPDALVWLGRRTAYLGRYNEAVDVFTRGVVRFPGDPRFLRHRGHRYITLRLFDLAVRDLEKAAALVEGRPDEIEPAGTPNARGVVLDTLKQNVFYHLALARYLRGDFEGAMPAWRECARYSENPDSLCSVTHWTYMTLRRLGRELDAGAALEPIRADLDVVEYHSYHKLCLVYRGELDADTLWETARGGDHAATDFPTIGYGVGNWHLYNGRKARALEVLREVASAPMWAAFGRIAAEADLARLE